MVDSDTHPKPSVEALAALDIEKLTGSVGFKEWAGNDWQQAGEVVTKEGVPVVFYHGGSPGIKEFNRDNPRNTSERHHGHYFSPRVHVARFFADKLKAEQAEVGGEEAASLYAVILKMKNPLVVKGGEFSSATIASIPEGYDGAINTQSQEVVVFNPDQIFIAAEAKH